MVVISFGAQFAFILECMEEIHFALIGFDVRIDALFIADVVSFLDGKRIVTFGMQVVGVYRQVSSFAQLLSVSEGRSEVAERTATHLYLGKGISSIFQTGLFGFDVQNTGRSE